VRTRNSLGVKIFGILALAWGIRALYKAAAYFVSKPWLDLELSWKEWIVSADTLWFVLIPTYLVASGIGLLKGKPWARWLLLITTGMVVTLLAGRLVVMGPCTEETRYVMWFGIAAFVFWFFNRPAIRSKYPQVKGMKILAIVWVATLLSGLVWAAISWFREGGPESPRLQKGVYEYKGEDFYASDYVRTRFPLMYTMVIPKDSVVRMLYKDESGGIDIWVTPPEEHGLITLGNYSWIEQVASFGGAFDEDADPYRVTRKLFAERYGIIPRLLRKLVVAGEAARFEEARIDGLTAFIARSLGETARVEFQLFQNRHPIGAGSITAPREGGGLRIEQIDNIISSIRPQEEPPRSAAEYFQEGVGLFDAGEVEAAKFSFSSALCVDWENADCHYYMVRAFLETDNAKSAWEHLKEGMSLNPDYPEAKALLERMRAAEW